MAGTWKNINKNYGCYIGSMYEHLYEAVHAKGFIRRV